jgi:restriction endonuclease S subunit
VKAGWQTTPFEDCIEQVTYTTKIQRKDFLSEGTFPIVSQEEDLINGRWENEADLFKVERPLVLFGDHTRSFKYVDFDFVLGADGVKILKPKTFLHPRYFYFQLQTAKLESLGYARHFRLLKEHSVSYPDFAEQHRIITLLDEAFADIATAKAKAEKNLQNARVLFESYRNSVFESRGSDWVEVRLGELCDFLNGFAFKSGDAVADSGTQLVRMGNLYGGKLDLERNAVYYPDSFSAEYQRFLLHEGDIIMSLTGTTGKEDFGFAVQVPETDRALLMNQRIVKFESIREDKICREYLLHYLCSRVFLNLLYPTANGTRQANLSSVTMKMLPVPTPSISLQQQIARSLDSLEVETQHLETIYRQRLTALDDLKKSLLHQAFSGQL